MDEALDPIREEAEAVLWAELHARLTNEHERRDHLGCESREGGAGKAPPEFCDQHQIEDYIDDGGIADGSEWCERILRAEESRLEHAAEEDGWEGQAADRHV